MTRLRTLAHFALIGALAAGAKRLVEPLPALDVVVAADADAASVDRAVLLAVAIERGWHRSDPVVRARLARNMRFVDPSLDERAAVDKAIALGMHRRDPVARERLVQAAGRALQKAPGPLDPAAQQRFLDAHADRYSVPPRVAFRHVFLSRARHGEALERRAADVKRRLEAGEDEGKLADRFIAGRRFRLTTAARIDGVFGPGFAARLEGLEEGRWQGPVPSGRGLHFVWIEARRAAEVPQLEAVRGRVARDMRVAEREDAVREGLTAFREARRVRVVRRPR